jgi:hypothetical protein
MAINAKLKKTGDLFEIHNEKNSLSGVVELEKGKLYSGTLYSGQFLPDKAPDGYTVFLYTERQKHKEFQEEDLEKVKAVNLRLHRVPTASTELSKTNLQTRTLRTIQSSARVWAR